METVEALMGKIAQTDADIPRGRKRRRSEETQDPWAPITGGRMAALLRLSNHPAFKKWQSPHLPLLKLPKEDEQSRLDSLDKHK